MPRPRVPERCPLRGHWGPAACSPWGQSARPQGTAGGGADLQDFRIPDFLALTSATRTLGTAQEHGRDRARAAHDMSPLFDRHES